MSEEFEREVLGRFPLDRRALLKKMVLGAAFAAPVIASFNMVGLDAGTAHGLTTNTSRQGLICQQKTALRDQLKNEVAGLPAGAPAALKVRLQKRINTLDAWIAANC